MRIARTAATLALVLAASACGNSPTEPDGKQVRESRSDSPEVASRESAVPLRSGNTIGSGS